MLLMGRVVGPNVSSGGAEKVVPRFIYSRARNNDQSLCLLPLPSKEQEDRGSQRQGFQSSPHYWERARIIINFPWGSFSVFPLIYYYVSPHLAKKKKNPTHRHQNLQSQQMRVEPGNVKYILLCGTGLQNFFIF